MYYDAHYSIILPSLVALPLILVLNILVPIAAIYRARAVERRKWLPHTLAFLWVLASVYTFYLIGMPKLAPDEEPGPGDGLLLLPILLETAIISVGYFIALIWLLLGRLVGRNASQSQSPS
ncbi:hypothetical protein MOV66_02335 [Agrobacterium sp. SHOUNA12C]|nr:hypothetical protein [Agrobacterium sp. BETTINA12B]MCJ9755472.1 hypothetical protein [Agrobacterium sp. SHOUNA12C]NTG34822.1 hypothetical protein [Rhizobium rhizogenes]NTG54071.1 hypothetical protein [Rhizobium rhizogenes]